MKRPLIIMSFLSFWFAGCKRPAGPPRKFAEGDVVYAKVDNDYVVSKILKIEPLLEQGKPVTIYHCLTYAPLERQPVKDDIERLQVLMMHAPMDGDMMDREDLLLGHETVHEDELAGYREYLRQR